MAGTENGNECERKFILRKRPNEKASKSYEIEQFYVQPSALSVVSENGRHRVVVDLGEAGRAESEVSEKFALSCARFLSPGTSRVSDEEGNVVRFRRKTEGASSTAILTLKGQGTGFTRPESETEVSASLLEASRVAAKYPPLVKTRSEIEGPDGKTWEFDEFGGALSGFLVAEIELASEQESFVSPSWLEDAIEVSEDFRFTNARMAKSPEIAQKSLRELLDSMERTTAPKL